eukprot:gene7444-biopygen16552
MRPTVGVPPIVDAIVCHCSTSSNTREAASHARRLFGNSDLPRPPPQSGSDRSALALTAKHHPFGRIGSLSSLFLSLKRCWRKRQRTRTGRGPDAGHTIEFEEADADRTRTGRGRGRFSLGFTHFINTIPALFPPGRNPPPFSGGI